MARTYDVYGVGHALVDIQYQVDPEFLELDFQESSVGIAGVRSRKPPDGFPEEQNFHVMSNQSLKGIPWP